MRVALVSRARQTYARYAVSPSTVAILPLPLTAWLQPSIATYVRIQATTSISATYSSTYRSRSSGEMLNRELFCMSVEVGWPMAANKKTSREALQPPRARRPDAYGGRRLGAGWERGGWHLGEALGGESASRSRPPG